MTFSPSYITNATNGIKFTELGRQRLPNAIVLAGDAVVVVVVVAVEVVGIAASDGEGT